MNKKLFKVNWRTVSILIVIGLLIPIAIGLIVSFNIWPGLSTSNDWIGFWGGYIGSIFGGLITYVVMIITINHERTMKAHDDEVERQRRNKEEIDLLCNRISKLVSEFCVEALSYRGRMVALKAKYGNNEIPKLEKIEWGANTEKLQRLLFELEMLVMDNDIASEIHTEMKNLLDNNSFPEMKSSELSCLLEEFRKEIRNKLESINNNCNSQ